MPVPAEPKEGLEGRLMIGGKYKGFCRACLDREYSPSSYLGVDAQTFINKYAAQSHRVLTTLDGHTDTRFGQGKDERLDLFTPDCSNAPIQVFFHGGYWQMCSKDDFVYPARAFVDAGIAYASINYSLLPDVDLDHIIDQSRRAIAWLYKNADNFGLDKDRIFVSGHSAGGHLAAMCFSTDWEADYGLPSGVIKGACLVSGIFDLEPLRHSSENKIFQFTPAAVRQHSPIFLDPRAQCHIIGCFGQYDSSEFKRQTNDYLAMCEGKGLSCQLLQVSGCHHFDVILELGNPTGLLFQRVIRQIGATET